jgi:type IV pilus assembly protein PilB
LFLTLATCHLGHDERENRETLDHRVSPAEFVANLYDVGACRWARRLNTRFRVMNEQLLALLRSTELFNGVPDDLLQRLAQQASRQAVRAGTVIFEQGAAAPVLLLVEQGSIELRRRDPLIGRDHLYARYGAGKTIGEEAVLADEPWSTAALAFEDAVFVAIPAESVRALASRVPSVGLGAAHILARRVNRLLAEKGVRYVPLGKIQPDPALVPVLPARMLHEHKLALLARRGNTVTVGMVNPQDLVAIDEVQRAIPDAYLEIVSVSLPALDAWLNKTLGPKGRPTEDQATVGSKQPMLPAMPARNHNIVFVQESIDASPSGADDPARTAAVGEQVIQALNRIIGDALVLDTSDIHIEPQPDGTVVRYRIDGQLVRRSDPTPLRLHTALVSRIKALSGMDITERRKPQDGRLGVQFNQREVALRISTVPTRNGEKVVLRILDRSNSLMNLDRLVVLPHVREMVRQMFFLPHGIVFITGPTGSGKTTTMYSAILERRNEGQNIVTIEDPIEYTIPGITQVQYNDKIDLGYAEAIKAFLRQDTDIMLIGETRDARTASNAMQAALSGHLVVTSIHTNSALGTVYRLLEMGIEPFLTANALGGVVAQRLVRTVCGDCRQPHKEDPSILSRLYKPHEEVPPMFKGAGCSRCNNTGYRGRTAILEVLPMTEELRVDLASGKPMNELRQTALRGGMVTFHEYARQILARGLSTATEVLRVLYTENDEQFMQATTVRCGNCGCINDRSHRFCQECGGSIENPV